MKLWGVDKNTPGVVSPKKRITFRRGCAPGGCDAIFHYIYTLYTNKSRMRFDTVHPNAVKLCGGFCKQKSIALGRRPIRVLFCAPGFPVSAMALTFALNSAIDYGYDGLLYSLTKSNEGEARTPAPRQGTIWRSVRPWLPVSTMAPTFVLKSILQ